MATPKSADVNITGPVNDPPAVVNQHDERGSAARTTTSVAVPAADAGASTASGPALMDTQSSVLGKRSLGEAVSPTHMETVAQSTPSAPARARALVLKGLDKEQRDRIQAADDQLALTRAVRALEANQKQVEDYLQNLHRAGQIQDANVQTIATDMEDFRKKAHDRYTEFDSNLAAKDKWLGEQLRTQEEILTARMIEIKDMFIKCDQVLVKLENMQNIETKSEALLQKLNSLADQAVAPVAPEDPGPANPPGVASGSQDMPQHSIALKALDEAKRSGNLLRTKCDELQREMNKMGESIIDLAAASVTLNACLLDPDPGHKPSPPGHKPGPSRP